MIATQDLDSGNYFWMRAASSSLAAARWAALASSLLPGKPSGHGCRFLPGVLTADHNEHGTAA